MFFIYGSTLCNVLTTHINCEIIEHISKTTSDLRDTGEGVLEKIDKA